MKTAMRKGTTRRQAAGITALTVKEARELILYGMEAFESFVMRTMKASDALEGFREDRRLARELVLEERREKRDQEREARAEKREAEREARSAERYKS